MDSYEFVSVGDTYLVLVSLSCVSSKVRSMSVRLIRRRYLIIILRPKSRDILQLLSVGKPDSSWSSEQRHFSDEFRVRERQWLA